ncbi:MAG: sigma-70 family RNA polymerase sigma factor [bacterium]|nr:sigma-70 family RNA polymerase sigma factor [bacterium]
MSAHSDHIESLFEQARTGDELALEQYCAMVRRGLLLIAQRELPRYPQSAIEDIVHDTLEAFIQRRHQITGSSAAYLRGILYNKIHFEVRQKYNGSTRFLAEGTADHVDSSSGVEDVVELKDRAEHCVRLVSRLGEPDRTMLIESLKGTSIDGIWEWYRAFNPTSKFEAFKRRLYRARQRLWSLLEEDTK